MLLPKDSIINTAASGSAANGNITVTGNIIQLGSLVADAGTGTSGGAITITTGINPNVIDGTGGGVQFDSTGSIINSGSFGAQGNIPSGSGGVLAIGQGSQMIRALGDITLINRNEINVNLGTGQSNTMTTRGGDIGMHNYGLFLYLVAKAVTTGGGDLAVSANGIVSISVTDEISTKPTSGSGGSVSIICNGTKDAQINAAGLILDTRASGVGDGGDVTIEMPANLTLENDPIDLGTGTITTTGAGGSSDGDVSVVGATSTLTVGTIQAGHGNVQISTQASGAVALQGNITAGALNITSGSPGISSASSNLILTVDDIAFNSSFSSQLANSVIAIRPLTSSRPVAIGNVAGGLNLSISELASFNTGTLVLGSLSGSGGISASGNIALAGNLDLTSAGAVSTTSATVDIATYDFSIYSSNTVNLGTIQGDTGSTSIVSTGAVNINSNLTLSGAGSALLVDAGGLVSSPADLSASTISLKALSGFNVAGDINALGALTLTSGINLTNSQFAGSLTAATMNLITVSGASIGTASATPFTVGGIAKVSIESSGAAHVKRTGSSAVELLQSNSASDFEFATDGSLLISGNVVTTDGSILMSNGSGELRVAADVDITADGSDPNIGLINTGSEKNVDSIAIGHGAKIEAFATSGGFGNVLIQLGAPQTLQPSWKPPRNVRYNVVGSGQILFGGPGNKIFVTASKRDGINTFNAKDANILISNALHKKSISFEGAVTLTADPPVTGSLTNSSVVETSQGSVESSAPPAMSHQSTAPLESFSILNMKTPDYNWLGLNRGVPSVSDSVNILDDSVVRLPSAFELEVDVIGDIGQPSSTLQFSDSDLLEITHGQKLLAATRDTVMSTAHGVVRVSSGALVLIVANDKSLSVFDLHDRHKDSVVVEHPGKSVSLAPGRHIHLSAHDPVDFAQVNPVESVLHRNVVKSSLSSGGCVFLSEFSMPSLISTVHPLNEVMQRRTKRSAKLANDLVKTSAILLHLSSSEGFRYHVKPRSVAMRRR
ncbi:MAG: hypothetical protein K2X93_14280 [Candidatus Obscuribacterales bacterium]|nr:hypothetical protein [Candidatus Obscuribacterales bacterium]